MNKVAGRSTHKWETKRYELRIAGETIFYTVTWKAVKNVNLRIMPTGVVKVSAPVGMPWAVISNFVATHKSFIIRNRQRFAEREKGKMVRTYAEGDIFYILGYQAKLQVELCDSRQTPYVSWSESDPYVIYMYVKADSQVSERAQLMGRFWSDLCDTVIRDILDRVYNCYIDAGYDVPYPRLRVRQAKTRWGSCSLRTQRIMINQQLLQGPRHFIEYVMIHEFAHFLQPNHSPKFWQIVADFMPQWQSVRHELTAYFRGY